MNSISTMQEIQNNAVSIFHIHLPKLFSKKNETLAGVTYPIPPNTPACVSVALMVERGICNAKAQGSTPCGYIQGAEIDLSVVDGKHNRTGRRQARGSVIPIIREPGLHVGSNPTHPIPASLASPFLSDPGAGNFFNTTLTPTPAPTIIIRYSGCSSAMNAVSLPLRRNQSDHRLPPTKMKEKRDDSMQSAKAQLHKEQATVLKSTARDKVYSCAA